MSLIKTSVLLIISLFVFSCGFFKTGDLTSKYSDGNITVELKVGVPLEPGNIVITSSIDDTIQMRSLNIDFCTFANYTIESMKYSTDQEKWTKGEIMAVCFQYNPPLTVLPMETKSIDILPVLPSGAYTLHMFYAVETTSGLGTNTEIELGLYIKD